MHALSYQVEIDKIDNHDWDNLIREFDDSTIYQSWAFGALTGRCVNLYHIVLKKDHKIFACCQVSFRSIPFLRTGIADIKWGPLCVRRNQPLNEDALFQLIDFVKNEFSIKKGYMIRIWPHVIGKNKDIFFKILEDEGFKRNTSERPYRTFMVDLTQSQEDIRKNFLQKWRNCLNKAEKQGLSISFGITDSDFLEFITLAKEMVSRKDLALSYISAFENYRQIQNALPEQLKMQIAICRLENEPLAAAVFSAIGDTGIYLLGASGDKGLKSNASYLLQWHIIQRLKGSGVKKYDLGAFNPQLNPSVYHFKAGIVGKKAWEETFLGEHHGCFSVRAKVTQHLLRYRTSIQNQASK